MVDNNESLSHNYDLELNQPGMRRCRIEIMISPNSVATKQQLAVLVVPILYCVVVTWLCGTSGI